MESSRPPSSLQIVGLEHMNSLACRHCTAAESHKYICLPSPLRQLPCERIRVVGHWWYQHWWQAFPCARLFGCFELLIPQSHELVEIFLSHWRFCTSRISLMSSFLDTLSFTSNYLESFLDKDNQPNRSWPIPTSTKLVEVSSSKEAVVLQAMGFGCRDRKLVAERSEFDFRWKIFERQS